MAVKIEVKGPIVSNDAAGVYHYFGWDACGPSDVSGALEAAKGDDVVLEINSNGGLCTAGFEMYTAVMQYEGSVTAHVINACSAATLVACAADKALVSDTAMYMIHNTQGYASGDYRDMSTESECLQEFNTSIVNAYEKKTGMDRKKIQALMDEETYMSPQKAIELGFVDGYMFAKDTVSESDTAKNGAMVVINAAEPILSEDKAHEIMQMIYKNGVQNSESGTKSVPNDAAENKVTENEAEKGGLRMTLKELCAEDAQANAELEARVTAAREEGRAEAEKEAMEQGAQKERERLQALDAIAKSVTADALAKAKYGSDAERMDAKELAYQAMLADEKKASAYMTSAMQDAGESGVNEVSGQPADSSAGAAMDESEQLAAYANGRRKAK